MFSRTSREEGRDLLPTSSGLGGFLWSPRQALPCRPRPISRELAEERPNPGGTHPCPHPPLFCLRTSPWGWKAAVTQGHSLRTPLLSCQPAARNTQSFPGTAARAREERATAGKCLLRLEIFTRGTARGPLPATCSPPRPSSTPPGGLCTAPDLRAPVLPVVARRCKGRDKLPLAPCPSPCVHAAAAERHQASGLSPGISCSLSSPAAPRAKVGNAGKLWRRALNSPWFPAPSSPGAARCRTSRGKRPQPEKAQERPTAGKSLLLPLRDHPFPKSSYHSVTFHCYSA